MNNSNTTTPTNSMKHSKKTESWETEVDFETISPRFSVHNTEELQQGIEHLNEHGYAVFSDILTNDEVNRSVDLLWKHLESLKLSCHIRRKDPQTWDQNW